MQAIAVIPARLGSTRLPRKVLLPVCGRPLLAHVYEAARRSPLLADVIVATDSQEIMDLCRESGWHARLTSPTLRSGTDRVHEISRTIATDVYVNIQGDEPMTRPEHIAVLLELMDDPAVQVGTLKTRISDAEAADANAVKVVTDAAGRALYFSRAPIPYDRDQAGHARYFKHLGFYAYRKSALDKFCTMRESALERTERLEQLRFLENGIAIHVAETPYDTIGVDTAEDLKRLEELLRNKGTRTFASGTD